MTDASIPELRALPDRPVPLLQSRPNRPDKAATKWEAEAAAIDMQTAETRHGIRAPARRELGLTSN